MNIPTLVVLFLLIFDLSGILTGIDGRLTTCASPARKEKRDKKRQECLVFLFKEIDSLSAVAKKNSKPGAEKFLPKPFTSNITGKAKGISQQDPPPSFVVDLASSPNCLFRGLCLFAVSFFLSSEVARFKRH